LYAVAGVSKSFDTDFVFLNSTSNFFSYKQLKSL